MRVEVGLGGALDNILLMTQVIGTEVKIIRGKTGGLVRSDKCTLGANISLGNISLLSYAGRRSYRERRWRGRVVRVRACHSCVNSVRILSRRRVDAECLECEIGM